MVAPGGSSNDITPITVTAVTAAAAAYMFTLQVDTFWCFVGLMGRLQGNFSTDQQGMSKQLGALRQLVQVNGMTAIDLDCSVYRVLRHIRFLGSHWFHLLVGLATCRIP